VGYCTNIPCLQEEQRYISEFHKITLVSAKT